MMSRPLRIEYPGAVYHVTSRGNEKRNIYRDDRDRNLFLEMLAEVVRRFHWIVTAYVLMSNHFHLVVKLTAANLSDGMHWLNGEYAKAFNRRHVRVGHLLQGRFDAPLIDEENYMFEVLRYVVLNPVRANIVPTPGEYEWSSYRATAGDTTSPPWLAVEDALANFGTLDRAIAQQRYRRFVEDGIGTERVPWDDLVGQVYLGSEEWIGAVRERVQSTLHPDDHPQIQRDVGVRSMADVVRAVADATQVDEGWLRVGRGGTGRMLAAWLARYEGQLPLRSIAAGLRVRSNSYISKLIRRCDAELATDTALRQLVERCSEELHRMWKSAKAQA